jgi:hypothetical protein
VLGPLWHIHGILDISVCDTEAQLYLGLSIFLVGKHYWYCSFAQKKKQNQKKKSMPLYVIVKHYGSLSVYSISRKVFKVNPKHLTFDPLRSYLTFCEKPLLADLENCLFYMHENFCLVRPFKLAENTVLLYCM